MIQVQKYCFLPEVNKQTVLLKLGWLQGPVRFRSVCFSVMKTRSVCSFSLLRQKKKCNWRLFLFWLTFLHQTYRVHLQSSCYIRCSAGNAGINVGATWHSPPIQNGFNVNVCYVVLWFTAFPDYVNMFSIAKQQPENSYSLVKPPQISYKTQHPKPCSLSTKPVHILYIQKHIALAWENKILFFSELAT